MASEKVSAAGAAGAVPGAAGVGADIDMDKFRTRWVGVTGDDRPEIFAQAADPQSPAFEKVWASMLDERLARVMRLAAPTEQAAPNPLVVRAFLEASDELLRIRQVLLAADQARTAASEQARHDLDAAQQGQRGQQSQQDQQSQAVEVDTRDEAAGTAAAEAGERGFVSTALAQQYSGSQVRLTTQVTAVSTGAALSVGMDPERAAALGSGSGGAGSLTGAKRVDRVSEVLLDLLGERATTNMAAVGITLGGTGRVARGQIPRHSLVNAALVLALRAGGTTGVELNPEGELLVELLGGTSGELARSASLEANLVEVADRLGALEKVVRNSHARSIEARDEAQLAAMISSFGVAERLRVVRVPLSGPDVVESVDVAAPAAVGLFDQMRTQADAYARKRRDDKGRMMTASQFRDYRSGQTDQTGPDDQLAQSQDAESNSHPGE